MKVLKQLFKLVYWSTILLIPLSIVAVYFSPENYWFAPFLSYALPAWTLLHFMFFLTWFYKKKYRIISAITLFIAIFGLWETFSIIPSFSKDGHKVMSYNVRLFDVYNWLDRENWDDWAPRKDGGAVLDSIYALLEDESAEILCFQEFFNQPFGDYQTKKKLKSLGYKYTHDAYSYKEKGSQYGMATFSKYPILYEEAIFFRERLNNGILISDVKFPEDTVRVINVHLQSFNFRKEDYRYLKSIKDSTWRSIRVQGTKDLVERLEKGFDKRIQQIALVQSYVQKSPHPVILCGDFNEIPLSFVYKTLTENMEDAFLNGGMGIGNSFITNFPFMRIDYILTSEGLKTGRFNVIKNELSDHYPITTYLEFE